MCFCIKVQVFIWCYSSRTVCKPTGGDDVTGATVNARSEGSPPLYGVTHGQARITGDDPFNLTITDVRAFTGSSAFPYGGRFPAGSLVFGRGSGLPAATRDGETSGRDKTKGKCDSGEKPWVLCQSPGGRFGHRGTADIDTLRLRCVTADRRRHRRGGRRLSDGR